MSKESPSIILLGLGPGDASLLTRQAWTVLESISELYLRTAQHPVVAQLPPHLSIHTFDDLYNAVENFEVVYAQIVEQVLALGRRPQGVVYAVPGHPFIAESTCPEIARRAAQEGLSVQVIDGLSFLEPAFTALGLDPLPRTALIDAFELAGLHVPSFPPDTPALVAQIHSRAIASEVKLNLMEVYPDEHPVVLVHAAGTPQQVVERLPLYEIDRSDRIGLLTSLYIPPLAPGTSFESFQELIAALRAPDGCPWDREQTHQTLRTNLLEETYEALDALDADNPQEMREEFGDLLLQIVLHAQIASEYGEYRMADVIQYIYDKIVRRHPHVFGDVQVDGVGHVLQNWEKIKAGEREANGVPEKGVLDGVSTALPALTQAQEYQARAARVGFEWPDLQGFLDKIAEECQEFIRAETGPARMYEIGDVFFTIVNLARRYNIDAESALRETNARFRRRFGYIEQAVRRQGRAFSDLTLDEMLALWQEGKSIQS
jgi:tetrapyrrole methylase family protein/MazG family protein